MAHENPLTSWDDYPVHQSADFIAHTASSDRNFYDRYYFMMHPSSDEMAVIFGLGQYPNLGVTDAFVAVRKGDGHHVVRASKPLVDRMDTSVGPIRVEIIEPLRRLRVVVEPTEHAVSMDVTWTGSVPAIAEPNQFIRSKGKIVFASAMGWCCATSAIPVPSRIFDVTAAAAPHITYGSGVR